LASDPRARGGPAKEEAPARSIMARGGYALVTLAVLLFVLCLYWKNQWIHTPSFKGEDAYYLWLRSDASFNWGWGCLAAGGISLLASRLLRFRDRAGKA